MTENKGDYASVDGLDMYHEANGSGEPLIPPHRGVGYIEMFGEVSPSRVPRRAAEVQAGIVKRPSRKERLL